MDLLLLPGAICWLSRLVMSTGQATACVAPQHAFSLCWSPPGRPTPMTYFITIARRRWPVEDTFTTGKDTFDWDRSQTRGWNGIGRHTALTALAQLHAAAIRGALTGSIQLLNATGHVTPDYHTTHDDDLISDADLQIPLGDAPVPVGRIARHAARAGV
jgi:hypothetical protein